jgi:hypothetical protein
MRDDEIVAKFRQLAAGRVGDERAGRIESLVGELERQERLDQLFDLLTVD